MTMSWSSCTMRLLLFTALVNVVGVGSTKTRLRKKGSNDSSISKPVSDPGSVTSTTSIYDPLPNETAEETQWRIVKAYMEEDRLYEEKRKKARKSLIMDSCEKSEEEKCRGYPVVRCYSRTEFQTVGAYQEWVCMCNYHYTLYEKDEPFNRWPYSPKKPRCVLNVFAPCTGAGGPSKPGICGANMDCVPDGLGISDFKFCRCRPDFAPALNLLGIPAFCRPIVWRENKTEVFETETGTAATVVLSLFLFRTSVILVFSAGHFVYT